MPAHLEQASKNKIEYLLTLSKLQKIKLRLAHLELRPRKIKAQKNEHIKLRIKTEETFYPIRTLL